MKEFYIGNVIKSPDGSMWIVTDVDDRVISAVAFDAENVSATQRLDDHERNQTCHCGDHPDFEGQPQDDCVDCHGVGAFVQKIKGWKHSNILAPTVKDFILKGVKRQFGF